MNPRNIPNPHRFHSPGLIGIIPRAEVRGLPGLPGVPGGTGGGFSLIEVLIAIFILAIGIISIASLFPVGILQQRQTTDDIMGPLVANNALALIRSRLDQEDFGTFEDFGFNNATLDGLTDFITIPGDWPWLRPGFVLQDDEMNPGPLSNPTPYNDQGTVDIFSHRYIKKVLDSSNEQNLLYATQFPDGLSSGGAPVLWGIPFNRSLHRLNFGTPQPAPPKFIITQQERYFPQQSQASFDASGDPIPPKSPQYTWDMMFRRFNGRIQVAIFVYRVTLPPGLDGLVYRVSSLPVPDERFSPLPVRFNLNANPLISPDGPWDAHPNPNLNPPPPIKPMFPVVVRGTEPGTNYDQFDRFQSWQEAGQWILDQNNNIHQVLSSGLEVDPDFPDNHAVELLRPIPPVMDNANLSGFGLYFYGPSFQFGGGFVYDSVVTDLWYIPKEIEVDADSDGQLNDGANASLTPVFIMVKEL